MPGKNHRKAMKVVGTLVFTVVVFFAGFLSGGYSATESIKARHEVARTFALQGAAASMALGHRSDAIELSYKALSNHPDLYEPYRVLGDAYRESGEPETALLMYRLALINSRKNQESDIIGLLDSPGLIELGRSEIREKIAEIEGKD